MDTIQGFSKKGKDSADAALGVAKNLQEDLGFRGQAVNTFAQLKQIESFIKDIQAAASNLGNKQDSISSFTEQIVGITTNILNEQATKAGLDSTGLMVESLSKQQARDAEKVTEKLEELDAKIRALQEAMKLDDVVVKTWFESEE